MQAMQRRHIVMTARVELRAAHNIDLTQGYGDAQRDGTRAAALGLCVRWHATTTISVPIHLSCVASWWLPVFTGKES